MLCISAEKIYKMASKSLMQVVVMVDDLNTAREEMKKHQIVDISTDYEADTMYGKDKKNKFDQALKRLVEDAYWNSDMEDDWVEDWEDKPEYNQKVKQCLQKLVASRQKNLDKFLNVKSFCAKNLPKLESHLDTVASLEAVYWGEAERLNTLKAELIVGLDQMRSKLDWKLYFNTRNKSR